MRSVGGVPSRIRQNRSAGDPFGMGMKYPGQIAGTPVAGMKDGAEVCRSPTQPQVNVNIGFTIDVAFAEGFPWRRDLAHVTQEVLARRHRYLGSA
jgi:hypothetical protein